jgi:hypothetical protein
MVSVASSRHRAERPFGWSRACGKRPVTLSLVLPTGPTLREYAEGLRAAGIRVVPGSKATLWAAAADRVLWRIPAFHVGTPSPAEVDGALRRTGALVASYLVEPDEQNAANAWLYLCSDDAYGLGTRAPAMRRNVRRGLRDLSIRAITPAEVLAHGRTAFCDTRRRTGLDDGTPGGFQRYFASGGGVDGPGRTYLGAWKDAQLAAFVTIVHVDDWVEVCCFSMDAMLPYRPNDTLLYVALSHYATTRKCRVVSYGVSSIQATSNAAGLHRFKRKIGFDTSPVHRAFVLHPSLRPLASRGAVRAAHYAVNAALRVRPRNVGLKKLEGVLTCILGGPSVMPAPERTGGHTGRYPQPLSVGLPLR